MMYRSMTWLKYPDPRIAGEFARFSMILLRISLGIVFLWFGVLKFFPELSPAEELATRTIEVLTLGIVQPALSRPVLATWEVLIGLGLITNRYLGATLVLLVVQMLGTFTPLVLFPQETWVQFPIAPTMEGQYILKNMVLISAGLVIGAVALGGWRNVASGPRVPQKP